MGGCRLAGSLCLVLILASCGGGDEVVRERDELPVSCVSRAGTGSCSPGSAKYFYDHQTDRCRPTGSARCGGRTLFDSLEACRRFCGAQP
jgi:hypothetical protein